MPTCEDALKASGESPALRAFGVRDLRPRSAAAADDVDEGGCAHVQYVVGGTADGGADFARVVGGACARHDWLASILTTWSVVRTRAIRGKSLVMN